MPPSSIDTLQAEIRQLEQDLARRRRALEILRQGAGGPASPGARAARSTTPATAAQQPTTRAIMHEVFTAAPSQRLTPKQMRERLQQRGRSVSPETVRRQLSALVTAKVVTHQNGQYGLATTTPAQPSAAATTPTQPSATATKPSQPARPSTPMKRRAATGGKR